MRRERGPQVVPLRREAHQHRGRHRTDREGPEHPHPLPAEDEEDANADGRGGEASSRGRQVHGEAERREHSGGRCTPDPAVGIGTEPPEQQDAEREAGAEAVPVAERIAQTAIAERKRGEDAAVGTAEEGWIEPAQVGAGDDHDQADRDPGKPGAGARPGGDQDGQHEEAEVSRHPHHLGERAAGVVGPDHRQRRQPGERREAPARHNRERRDRAPWHEARDEREDHEPPNSDRDGSDQLGRIAAVRVRKRRVGGRDQHRRHPPGADPSGKPVR